MTLPVLRTLDTGSATSSPLCVTSPVRGSTHRFQGLPHEAHVILCLRLQRICTIDVYLVQCFSARIEQKADAFGSDCGCFGLLLSPDIEEQVANVWASQLRWMIDVSSTGTRSSPALEHFDLLNVHVEDVHQLLYGECRLAEVGISGPLNRDRHIRDGL